MPADDNQSAAGSWRRLHALSHQLRDDMVMRFGMSERLGSMAYERDPRSVLSGPGAPFPPHEREYAEKTAGAVDEEVRSMIDRMLQRAREILDQRRGVLNRSAQRLLEQETLEERELIELLGPPVGSPLRDAAE